MRLGPTLAEMREPWTIESSTRKRALAAKHEDPLDPVNLYNITWYDAEDEINSFVIPEAVTGIETPIAWRKPVTKEFAPSS